MTADQQMGGMMLGGTLVQEGFGRNAKWCLFDVSVLDPNANSVKEKSLAILQI